MIRVRFVQPLSLFCCTGSWCGYSYSLTLLLVGETDRLRRLFEQVLEDATLSKSSWSWSVSESLFAAGDFLSGTRQRGAVTRAFHNPFGRGRFFKAGLVIVGEGGVRAGGGGWQLLTPSRKKGLFIRAAQDVHSNPGPDWMPRFTPISLISLVRQFPYR